MHVEGAAQSVPPSWHSFTQRGLAAPIPRQANPTPQSLYNEHISPSCATVVAGQSQVVRFCPVR